MTSIMVWFLGVMVLMTGGSIAEALNNVAKAINQRNKA